MNIYDQHAKAFNQVSAYVCIKDSEILRINLKFSKDGAGRLWAYVHLLGNEMVRDYAGGYGYDKRTAAVAGDCEKVGIGIKDSGYDWEHQLREQGWTVLQAV